MKFFSRRTFGLLGIATGLGFLSGTAEAQTTLYWGRETGIWGDSSFWGNAPGGPYNTSQWANGDSAVIENANPAIDVKTSTAVTDLTITAGLQLYTSINSPNIINFTLNGAGSGDMSLANNPGAGTGIFRVHLSGSSAYAGTIDAIRTSSAVVLSNTTGVGVATKIALNGGSLALDAPLAGQTVTIGELSGAAAGSSVTVNFGGTAGTKTLRVEQSGDTAFAGTLAAGTGNRVLALTKAGSGSLTLAGNSANEGPMTVEAGRLNINGTTSGQGNYRVESGAALGGNGTIGLATGGVRNVTVASGGILAPGTAEAVGTLLITGGDGSASSRGLVFEGAATITFRLGSTQDLITLGHSSMTGSAAGGAGSITFDFLDAGGSLAGETYDLISFGGTSPGIALSAFALSSASLAAGWSGDFLYGGDGNTLQFQVATIPEPGTAALLVLTTAGLLAGRRSGKRA